MMPRVQPPATSPVRLRTLWRAGLGVFARSDSAGAALAGLLRRHCQGCRAVFADSGTSALALAMRAAFLARDRRPVALPAYGCYDLMTAAAAAHVPVSLYDVDPYTLAPDADGVHRLFAAGLSALVVVHHYGVPAAVSELGAAAHSAGALLIEDAAQAFGARTDAGEAGAGGDFGIFSFGRGKGISGGRGGALLVCTEDAAGAHASSDLALAAGDGGGLRDFAALAALWLLARPNVYALPASIPYLRLGETILRPPHAPAAPSAVALRAVTASWTASIEEVAVRRRHAEQLLPSLRQEPMIACGPVSATSSWLRLPILASPGVRDRARARAAWRIGIQYAYPLLLNQLPDPASARRNDGASFPGARQVRDHLITLPTHGRLRPRDIAALHDWIHDAARADAITATSAINGAGLPARTRNASR